MTLIRFWNLQMNVDGVKTLLDQIDVFVEEINVCCTKKHIVNFYDTILLRIAQIVDCVEEITKFISSPSLKQAAKKILLHCFADLNDAIRLQREMSAEDRLELESKTTMLWQDQAKIHKSIMFSIKQEAKIMEIWNSSIMPIMEIWNSSIMPSCYFCYAWPTSKNQKQESWIQPFLEILYDELREIGIRAIMDTKDCGPGENMVRFMRQCSEATFVFVFGTNSLLEKHQSGSYNNVQTELATVMDRLENRVVPILLTGTIKSSFPAFISTRKVMDARNDTPAPYRTFLHAILGIIKESS